MDSIEAKELLERSIGGILAGDESQHHFISCSLA